MTAQKGKDLLLKVDGGGGAFATVAGLRSNKLAFNAQTVDVTDAESAGRWRELLGGGGVQRASVSGSGIFKDAESDARVRGLFFDGAIAAWQVVVPDFGTVSGPFQVTALEYAGRHDGEVTFDVALESAGALAFGAVVTAPARPANRRRGEVSAVIDGEARILCLTLGALAELEQAFEADNLADLAKRFSSGALSAADMIRILGAGLRGGGNLFTDEDVAEATVEDGVAGTARVVAALLGAAFGDEAACDGTNPPAPQES